jgi:hypothetical protein
MTSIQVTSTSLSLSSPIAVVIDHNGTSPSRASRCKMKPSDFASANGLSRASLLNLIAPINAFLQYFKPS